MYSIWNELFCSFYGHFHYVFSTFTNVVHVNVENDNVVSTMSNVAYINVEIHKIDSTLFDVVNSNVEIRNVVSTLIWRWPTLYQPKDNVETTWKRLLGDVWKTWFIKYTVKMNGCFFQWLLWQNLSWFFF